MATDETCNEAPADALRVSYGVFLRWLSKHLQEAPTILVLAQKLVAPSSTIQDRGDALKGLIDVFVLVMLDWPTEAEVSAMGAVDEPAVEAEVAKALAIDIGTLLQLWQILKPFLPLLLELLRGIQKPTT